MSDVRSALKYSVVTQYVFRALTLLNVVVIARLLTPEELGVFAIVAAIILMVGQLKSFGASQYIIKQESIDRQTVRVSLGLSALISWPIGAGLILFSYPIQSFYGQADLALLICISALSFFTAPHSGMARALIEREFDFKRRFYISSTVQTLNVSLSIVLVLLGYSYFSMAIAASAAAFFEAALYFILRKPLYCVIPSFKGVKKVAKFGVFISLTEMLRNANNVLPDLIIGKLGNSANVAFFSRGMGFLEFLTLTISSGIRGVALPYISHQKRLSNNLTEAYSKATELTGVCLIPVMAVAGMAAYPVIEAFFGDQWSQSAALVQILCIWSMLKAMNIITPFLLIATDCEKKLFLLQLFSTVITFVSIAYLYQYGLAAVAWGLVFSSLVEAVGFGLLLSSAVGASPFAFISANRRNMLIAALCAGITYGLDRVLDFNAMNSFIAVGIIAAVIAPIWFGLLFVLKHPLRDELVRAAKPMLKKINRGKKSVSA